MASIVNIENSKADVCFSSNPCPAGEGQVLGERAKAACLVPWAEVILSTFWESVIEQKSLLSIWVLLVVEEKLSWVLYSLTLSCDPSPTKIVWQKGVPEMGFETVNWIEILSMFGPAHIVYRTYAYQGQGDRWWGTYRDNSVANEKQGALGMCFVIISMCIPGCLTPSLPVLNSFYKSISR